MYQIGLPKMHHLPHNEHERPSVSKNQSLVTLSHDIWHIRHADKVSQPTLCSNNYISWISCHQLIPALLFSHNGNKPFHSIAIPANVTSTSLFQSTKHSRSCYPLAHNNSSFCCHVLCQQGLDLFWWEILLWLPRMNHWYVPFSIQGTCATVQTHVQMNSMRTMFKCTIQWLHRWCWDCIYAVSNVISKLVLLCTQVL